MKPKTLTYNLSELPNAAKWLLENISGKTLLFYGEMGVGKTTLIKELAKQLGFSGLVSSPTFSLVNEYENGREKLYHFDFYRIEDENEALDIGVEEYLYSGHWNFIEWPDKIKNLIPENSVYICLSKNSDNTRTLNISF